MQWKANQKRENQDDIFQEGSVRALGVVKNRVYPERRVKTTLRWRRGEKKPQERGTESKRKIIKKTSQQEDVCNIYGEGFTMLR